MQKGPNSRFNAIAQPDKPHHNEGKKQSFTMDMILASLEETRPSAPRAPKCVEGHEVLYSNQYDAYYCVQCVMWMTEVCQHDGCTHCNTRPKYPDKCVSQHTSAQAA